MKIQLNENITSYLQGVGCLPGDWPVISLLATVDNRVSEHCATSFYRFLGPGHINISALGKGLGRHPAHSGSCGPALRMRNASANPRSGCDSTRLERPDVTDRGKAKAAAVLSTKLADTFVSHLVCSGRCIQTIHQHSFPRGLQPKHLLVLQRTHRGQYTELMVESGNTHACCVSEYLNVKRFGKIGT